MNGDKRYQWLCEVISAIGSSLELEKVLKLAIDVTTKASNCSRCFIYLYDKQREKLVVRATTPGQEKWIGTLELSLDEGLTGWTAKNHEAVLTDYEAIKDKRFLKVKGLEDEEFHNFMTVPIVSPANEMIGVFTMCILPPYRFTDEICDFIANIATLLAGLIEKAMLYEQMKKKLTVLDRLANLSKVLSKDDRVNVILGHIRKIVLDVLDVDSCMFMLLNREQNSFSIEQSPWVLSVSKDLKYILEQDMPLTGTINDLPKGFDKLVIGDFKSWVAVPMHGKSSPVGITLCFFKDQYSFWEGDLSLLQTISHQGTLALERALLVSYLSDRSRKQDFFDALFSSKSTSSRYLIEQGRSAGINLERPNIVLVVEATHKSSDKDSEWLKNFCFCLEDVFEKAFPDCLYLTRNGIIQVIIPVNDSRLIKEKLTTIKDEQERKNDVLLFIGIGNTCNNCGDYRRGLEEAIEALTIGKAFFLNKSRVISFNELGLYRYLYKVWKNDGIVRDKQQQLMTKLYEFDKEHNTDLLITMEKYFECSGKINNAASELFIHRNTMRNRLEKISSILEANVTDQQNWFSLYIALQIVKLKELDESINMEKMYS